MQFLELWSSSSNSNANVPSNPALENINFLAYTYWEGWYHLFGSHHKLCSLTNEMWLLIKSCHFEPAFFILQPQNTLGVCTWHGQMLALYDRIKLSLLSVKLNASHSLFQESCVQIRCNSTRHCYWASLMLLSHFQLHSDHFKDVLAEYVSQ